jgi:hypothetical protein
LNFPCLSSVRLFTPKFSFRGPPCLIFFWRACPPCCISWRKRPA